MFMHRLVENFAARPSMKFRAIHCRICIPQHVDSGGMGGIGDDTNTGGSKNILATDYKRFSERILYAFRDADGVAGVPHVVQKNGEFIAPKSGQSIILRFPLWTGNSRWSRNKVFQP